VKLIILPFKKPDNNKKMQTIDQKTPLPPDKASDLKELFQIIVASNVKEYEELLDDLQKMPKFDNKSRIMAVNTILYSATVATQIRLTGDKPQDGE
jgi:hypothetical protein